MMATLSKAQSRRLYSWWWDSHISPKNSKWLQENLSDMDMKVKAMLKLIEEDADSFARRAEMYYKKRPELVKLVEEFYRAYRALAERYDHATGALRQAHETMEEAFPNRVSFATPDQPRSRSSASEPEPCTPEPTSSHTPFDPDESQKHSTGVPSMLHSSERNGAYTDEVDNLLGENGLKQLTEICATAGVEMHSEGSATKGLNFQEEEGKVSKHKRPSRLKDLHKHAFIEEEYIGNEIKRLQEEVSQLAKENKELDEQIASETRRADEAETEVQSIKNILSKLNSEKEATCLQYQLSIEKLSNLEAELSRTNVEFWELNDNMLMGVEKLKHADENCLLLEKANQSLKRELDTLNKRHHGIVEQMEAVGLHLDSLKVLFKELKNEKLVLQEIGKQYEDGRQHILEKLRNLENVREKNVVLENTLSDLHDELEESRKKIKALEEYCESLHAQIAVHATEKAEMVSQIEAMAWNREKLTEKNTFLENSLSDASTELEGMRGELQGLTESFRSLNDQNAIKLAEKNTLLVEMENIGQCLNNLERRHAELQEKCLFLEREKELVLLHVEELQDFLKIAKQEHENLIESSTIQLANLNYQMRQLQEEGQLREEEFGSEQQKFMNAEIEIFVLQRCLRDMKESNLVLSRECQVHMDALKCIENQKFHFEREYLAQKQTMASLTERIGKLSEGIFGLLKELRKNTEFQLLGNMNDESLVQFLSHEIKNLLTSLSDVQDENQHLMLDRLVLLTLLKQIGLDARCMGSEEDFLEKQLIVKNKELAQIKNEKQELMEMNKQLILDLQYSIHRQESFNEELKIACGELSDLREGHSILQGQNLNLLRDNQLMSVKFDELREAKENIEDENFLILSEVMTLECLSSIFQSISIERALELHSCNTDFAALVDIENGLNQEIRLLNEKLRMVEVENSQLKQMVVSLDESRSRCTIPENGLTAVRNLTSISSEDNVDKGNEVVTLCQENAILNEELHKMRTELEQLKEREKHLTSKLQRGINEMKYCEAETAASLVEFQLARTKSELFEQKLLELILAFESLEIGGMQQKEILSKAISLRDVHQDELKEKLDAMEGENRELKAGICAYMPLVMSLHHCIAALEQRILPLATQRAPNIEEKQDNMLEFHHLDKGNQEGSEDHSFNMPVEILELQKLLSKMDALQNVVLESMRRLEDQKKEHWGLRSEDISGQEVKTSSNVMQLEEREIPGLHLKLQEDDSEMCGENHGQIMKDIRLDCASTSTYRSDANSYGTEDQILEPWQTPVRDFSNPMEMDFSPPKEHDIRHHEIQEASILASDKQLGIIDKLAPTSKVPQSHQQWSSRVIEKLASYEDRLAVLQAGFEELKEQIEASDKRKYQASFSLGAIKLQVKESEGTIRALIDINNALKKKAGDFSACSSSVVKEQKESIDKSKRQISVWAQKVSEKIERLELEMHKIQYVLLKLEEEHEEYLARGAGRRRVVLKDYLYGRKSKQRDKRAYLSGCVKPKTDNK